MSDGKRIRARNPELVERLNKAVEEYFKTNGSLAQYVIAKKWRVSESELSRALSKRLKP